MNWWEEATMDFLEDQAEFNRLVAQIASSYAGSFSAAENLTDPGDTGVIYFKGTVPATALQTIQSSGLPIDVVDGRSETAAEMEAHSEAVADYVEAQGVTDFFVEYDVDGDVVLTIGSGQSAPTMPPSLDYQLAVHTTTTRCRSNMLRQGEVLWASRGALMSARLGSPYVMSRAVRPA